MPGAGEVLRCSGWSGGSRGDTRPRSSFHLTGIARLLAGLWLLLLGGSAAALAAPPATGTPSVAAPAAPSSTPRQGPVLPPAGQTVTPPPTAGGGEAIDNARQYRHCIALARSKPEDGLEEALAWDSLGGGEAARHCAAIALFGMKSYEQAAMRLEALAQESRKPPKLRAGMLDQAAQSWLLAKNPDRAYAAVSAALKLVPNAPDLLIDRAEILGAARNYGEALKDLNTVLKQDSKRVDALTYRGTAKRFLDDLKGAEADIDAALKLDPQWQDAWLEKGNLRRIAKDDKAARLAWRRVIELAPDSPAAHSAQNNLEMLDIKPKE